MRIDSFTATQLYRLALVGEKSSLRPILGPIAERYGADLVLFTGNASNTRIYELAKAAADDPRPLVVLYFSDCDPWGWRMSIEVARKLQAFATQQFPGLEYRVYRAALTPEQVLANELPVSPIEVDEDDQRPAAKAKRKQRQDWIDAHGVEQTEIDALTTLQPELLGQITEEWIARFWDDTLEEKVHDAAEEWRVDAQQTVDNEIDQDELDDAVEKIDGLRDEIQQILDERVEPIIDAAENIELPDVPELPEAEVDEGLQPMGLIDLRWTFVEQTRRLIAEKKYGLED